MNIISEDSGLGFDSDINTAFTCWSEKDDDLNLGNIQPGPRTLFFSLSQSEEENSDVNYNDESNDSSSYSAKTPCRLTSIFKLPQEYENFVKRDPEFSTGKKCLFQNTPSLRDENSSAFEFSEMSTYMNSQMPPSKRHKVALKKTSPNDITAVPETPTKVTSLNKFKRPDSGPAEELIANRDGSRLNNDFDIVDVIGTGSFGTVYRARGRLDNALYAIKCSRRRFRGTIDRARMMHEVHALAEISSKEGAEKVATVVRYFSAWVEDDHVCIQMELCDTSLDGMIMNSFQFQPKDVYGLLRDVLLALDLLHRNDFAHLDVKPANILVKNGHYKLGDFGLAMHTTSQGKAGSNVEEGDCRYMARELLDWGRAADLRKCDIFSLGISTLEISTRIQVAAEGPPWHELRNGLTMTSPQVATLPTELQEILISLMAASPSDRPTADMCLSLFTVLKSDIERELMFQIKYNATLKSKLDSSQGTKSKMKRCNTMG